MIAHARQLEERDATVGVWMSQGPVGAERIGFVECSMAGGDVELPDPKLRSGVMLSPRARKREQQQARPALVDPGIQLQLVCEVLVAFEPLAETIPALCSPIDFQQEGGFSRRTDQDSLAIRADQWVVAVVAPFAFAAALRPPTVNR